MDHHLKAIQVFCKVVETGSFTRAAELLDMPKSTVSKLVQQLENHLKVRLLHRTTRRLSITNEGQAYYELTTKLLHELNDIESFVSHKQTEPRGLLRVNVASAIANYFILPNLHTFQAKYPHIQLELGVTDTNIDLISENVDCVLRGGKLTDLSMVAKKLADLPFVTCAHQDYLSLHGHPQHPDELNNNHQLIYYRSGRINNKVQYMRFTQAKQSIEIKAPAKLVVSDSTSFSLAVQSGLGIAQLPKFLVADPLAQGNLITLFEDWSTSPIPLYLVYPPSKHLSGRLQAFMHWVIQLFEKHRHCTQP